MVNFYGDIDRFTKCDKDSDQTPEEAAAVFDLPLLLLAIYHIIEWLKVTATLTIICVKVNLVMCYYIVTPLNTLYGVIVIIWTMIVVFSE